MAATTETAAKERAKRRSEWRRKLLRKPFANPFCDGTNPKLWDEEVAIIERLLAGEELIQDRHYIEDHHTYGVHWYWVKGFPYPRQWDGPVTRLLARGVVRAVQCGGGATWVILTKAAQAVCGRPEFPISYHGPRKA